MKEETQQHQKTGINLIFCAFNIYMSLSEYIIFLSRYGSNLTFPSLQDLMVLLLNAYMTYTSRLK